MIAEAFAYAIAVTLLIGLAAVSVEEFLAELGRPRRFAWLGAYAVAVVFPLVSLLLAPDAPATDAALAPSAAAAVASPPIDWDALLLRLWAAATVLLLLAYLAAWICLAMLARRWPRVANDQAPVVLADDVGPAVLGVFRPRIVLPRWLAAGPDRVRSTVVAHELEHIAARDQAAIVATQLITVLLPWNLPLWWFARRLRAAIEVDCDARVLRRGVDPEHYADVLLAVGQRCSLSLYLAATLIEPVTQLERRIRIMLTRRKPGAARRAATAAALALALAACVARLEPPVVVTPEPSADAAEESAPARFSTVTVLPFLGRTPRRELSDGIVPKTEEGFVFEGNVVFEFDGTSITATRAVAKEGADGRMTLTLEDAGVTVGPSGAVPGNEPRRTEPSRWRRRDRHAHAHAKS
jgi:hypothetical protein